MAVRTGQQLDHYRLIRLLGKGTFGDVYLAENIHRKTQVAVKVLNVHLSKEEFYGFINEARIFRLRHPHIISVLDFGVDRAIDTPFLVLDYAPHGTLRQRHPVGSQIPLATVVEYVNQVAAALQYAHDENLVHRDVKPENMLIGANNEILLSDFGIAVVTPTTRTLLTLGQEIAGTPYYMAPEQFQGKPSRASDQYSLGVVVYEWLSGVRPFHGTVYELLGQHMHTPPPPLPQSVPLYSPELEQVVMKALAKDPRMRFARVQEFAAALEEIYKNRHAVPVTSQGFMKTKKQWLEEANGHYKAHRYRDVIAAYSRAIDLDPNSALTYNNRGVAYYHLQEYQLAVADYDRAIQLAPNNADAYTNRGVAYRYLQEYRLAIADYNRALQLDPNSALVYNNRGTAYISLEEYRQAIADFSRAIELAPDDAFAYYNRGIAYSNLEEYHQAIADFNRAIELAPDDALAYYNRGLAYDHLQEYQRAVEDYDRTLALDPDDSTANLARESRELSMQQIKDSS
ncbi:MAG TPA: serine/threonine-protein kinase [Ktedonobacteraceae bacterium]|nr:serine/threonine-protein kinase [Ktedonobacteraceae bacterium]